MSQNIQRRDFLTGSVTAAAVAAVNCSATAEGKSGKREFYEIRTFRNKDAAKQQVVLNFAERALKPALNRQGIDRIGIFRNIDAADAAVYVVIPYATLDLLAMQNDRLEQDAEYHSAAAEYFAMPKDDPAYSRIESRLLHAFAGMPVLCAPATDSPSRLVELRIYESHNEHLAKLKVEMFNKGEIDIMRDVKLAPVFFGETLISNDTPNLTYMLSADSAEAHQAHWDGFRKHPEWDRMKKLARYRGTVSRIVSITLQPTSGSEI